MFIGEHCIWIACSLHDADQEYSKYGWRARMTPARADRALSPRRQRARENEGTDLGHDLGRGVGQIYFQVNKTKDSF